MKKFNAKKVTGKAAVGKILIPIGCAFLGSIAGAAAGKTANLAVAGGLGVAAIALDEPNLTYAAVGAAVVTPAKSSASTAGIDGLDGFSDFVSGAKNRAFGQAKALLSNAKLDMIADKLPVSGLAGLAGDDAYEQGYIEGVNDAADELVASDGMESLNGLYNAGAASLPGPSGERMSVEALRLRSMGA